MKQSRRVIHQNGLLRCCSTGAQPVTTSTAATGGPDDCTSQVSATNSKQHRVAHLVSSEPRCRVASCTTSERPPSVRAATASCGSSAGRAFPKRGPLPWP